MSLLHALAADDPAAFFYAKFIRSDYTLSIMANWNILTSRGNVEDRRSFGPTAVGGLGLGGVALMLLLNYLGTGSIDLGTVLSGIEQAQVERQRSYSPQDFQGDQAYGAFAATVLGSANDVWERAFAESGAAYDEPKLVLFRGSTESACGGARSSDGPHYCPADETIYLDETFFEEISRRFGARGGDVAEAYVIAHEVAHHAQYELGIADRLGGAGRSNEASVALELQADCFAGLWAHSIRDLGVFEAGEIEEAMDMARAVGDDRIQQLTSGRVNPEQWTHGSSAERMSWFEKGYASGSLAACDTSAR